MLEPVLDPEQLRRIESTHRGFGYQHLYAVACLLDMARTETKAVVIERDEDVELIRADVHVYTQVKTRTRALRSSDIDSVLRRFGELRAAHRERRRPREARFAVVANVAPGPELFALLSSAEWPHDVAVVWPGQPGPAELKLPPASPDLATAVQSCIVQAELIPFSSLAPETLILKLAGLVQYVATGHLDHRITADEVTEFFEQLVLQLQEFPEPPAHYRSQIGEPPLTSSERVRLLVGVSGAGKTAWAARAAAQHAGPAMYFDVGELPPSAVASSLARELAARFLSNVLGAGGAALPTASGLELFAAISKGLGHREISVVVVLDNIHRLPVATVRNLVESATELRFVLLGQQPWVGQLELEALLGIKAWTLAGWSLDTIIATFAAAGCSLGAATGESIRQVTAGVPLYVQSATEVTTHSYGGDANAFLHALQRRLNLDETAQEAVLAAAVRSLAPDARTVAALLDLCDVALTTDEVYELVPTALAPPQVAVAVRALRQRGIVQVFHGGLIKLHDAYRILARDIRASLPAGTLDAAREALVALIERSLPAQWTVARFGLWLRLLTETGRIDSLIDVATHEEFHQVGDPQELKSALENAAHDSSLGVEERFWALDALVYWAQVRGEDDSRIVTLTDEMSAMADAHVLSRRALAELRMKQMYASAVAGRPGKVRTAYNAGADLAAGDPALRRLVRYNLANSLYRLGAYAAASSIAFVLVLDYYEHLNLDEEDVVATNPADILASVPDAPETTDNLRHTADCLYLLAACQRQLRRPVGLASLHAMKFYTAASAWRSGIQAGQDAVDQFVELGDPHGARHIAETFLLPAVSRYQLLDLLVPVRGQYAVVLAWCGEYEAARNELLVLEGYQLTPIGQQELANQRNLIEHIATHPPLDTRAPLDPRSSLG